LANPSVGVALAVAIAIHNIPEGLCIAIPVYYASGSRWKGFWMAFWSGVTELVGAALGYFVLKDYLGPPAYGATFGLVAGMMVGIVLKELLPTSYRYDPHDEVTTTSLFVGMFVMALSLVMFRL
jgi:ZIP family zinc transporter